MSPRSALFFFSLSFILSVVAAWRDAADPVPSRVAALLSNLSLPEKLAQLQRPQHWTNDSSGVGMLEFSALWSPAFTRPSQVAAARNSLVAASLASGVGARTGLVPSFRTFATHGGETFGTTFPQGPALASSWDVDLVASVAAATAAEARALGIDVITFVIHMVADARFGRQEEGFSEEPSLTAALGSACVAGAQGALGVGPAEYLLPPLAPTLFKHVGAYGQPSGGLNAGQTRASMHDVLDNFLKPWRAVLSSGARGVMPSHNTLLNVPAHGSRWLLTDTLRGAFNWSGLVLSDTGDIAALRGFRLCDDDASCAAVALNAGVDIEQPPGATYLSLPTAVARGLVNESTIDAAVARVLTHKFSAGLFDSAAYVNETNADVVVNSPTHRALAQAAAEKSLVLVKNAANSLPLKPGQRLAVLGPLGGCGSEGAGAGTLPPCEAQVALLGNYVGTGATAASTTGVRTFAEAAAAAGGAASVSFVRGADIDSSAPNASAVAAAVAAARNADAVLLVLGDSLNTCGENHDRDDLDLPGSQLSLLSALVAAELRAPIVLLLVNCRASTFGAATGNTLLNGVSAVIVAGRCGQECAAGATRVLFGAVSPSGKLVHNWVRSVGQVGGPASPWLAERNADWGGASTGAEGRTYGGYTSAVNAATPLWSFGEGLSYTSFSLSQLVVSPNPRGSPVAAVATLTVRNTGGMDGDCVVQLYCQDPVGVGGLVRPWKRLAGFVKVAVAVGGEVPVTIPVAANNLEFYGADGTLTVWPGTYVFSAGQSSVDDAGLVVSVNVE